MKKEPYREKRQFAADTPSSDNPPRTTGKQEGVPAMSDAAEERTASPSTSPAASAGFAPEELRAISQDLAEKFPIPIETTELVLMDVDPHHVHAYWNITPADMAAVRTNADHRVDETALVLRLKDLSPGPPAGAPPHEPVDIPVHGLENHWHVDLWHDARSYMAELGLRLPNGHLALLARSNPIDMPPAGESEGQAAAPADRPPRAVSADPGLQADESPAVTATVERPDPSLSAHMGQPLPPTFPNTEGSGISAPGIGAGADDIPVLPASPRGSAASLPPVRAHGPVATGSPTQLPTDTGVGPGVQTGTYSSSTLARVTDFEIQAELHVYGRGAPGGQLQLFGQRIMLGPDGRFSLRRPLSDPWAVLGLLATEPGDTGARGGDA